MTAHARALGTRPPEAFLATYGANCEAAHELALEASLVAGPLQDFVRARGAWAGTATDLLDTLTQRVGQPISRRREWPKTPTALGGQLRRLAPTLRSIGVEVGFSRGAWKRTITLTPVMKPGASASSVSSASSG